MSKPSYLALRYFYLCARDDKNWSGRTTDPSYTIQAAVLRLQGRYPEGAPQRDFIYEIYDRLSHPNQFDKAQFRDFDDAEERFLAALIDDGVVWSLARLNNELGKAGNYLGMKVPFLY